MFVFWHIHLQLKKSETVINNFYIHNIYFIKKKFPTNLLFKAQLTVNLVFNMVSSLQARNGTILVRQHNNVAVVVKLLSFVLLLQGAILFLC